MVTTILSMVAFSIITIAKVDAVPDRDDRIVSAAVVLTGAGSAEELGEDELERFRSMAASPLVLSRAPRSRLLSSGLFSAYQVASLWDYRQQHGDIISFAELASVNGFSEDFVEALKPFISLEQSSHSLKSPLGSRPGKDSLGFKEFIMDRIDGEVAYKGSVNVNGRQTRNGFDGTVAAGGAMKAYFTIADDWELGGGFKENSSFSYGGRDAAGQDWSAFGSWTGIAGRKVSLTRAVVGDYNLRFGQGLAMWGGFSIAGAVSPSSMSRNPTGLAPYRSYSGSSVQRGAAAEVSCGKFALTTAVSVPSIKKFEGVGLCANLAHYGMVHQESVTYFAVLDSSGKPSSMVASLDGRCNLKGYDFWGEVATNMKIVAAIAGARGKVIDNLTLAILLRYYPEKYESPYSGALRTGSSCTDEHAVTFALNFKGGKTITTNGSSFPRRKHLLDLSIDACCHPSSLHIQYKAIATYDAQFSPAWNVVTRFQLRQRNYDLPWRAELRTDISWMPSSLKVTARLDGLLTVNAEPELSGLAFIGAAWSPSRPALSIKARAGLYRTAGWPARIYVYEQDCPGFFNVPAFYGKGWWSSACCTYRPFDAMSNKFVRRLAISASVSYRQKMDDSRAPSVIVHLALSLKL